MVGPQIVDGGERHQAFELRLVRREDRLPPLLDELPLPLDHRFILTQELADVQVLPFDEPLNTLGVVLVFAVGDTVLHQQIVFERDEEA